MLLRNIVSPKSKLLFKVLFFSSTGVADLFTISTWLQKCVIMCVLQRLLQGLQQQKLIAIFWGILGATFIGAFIANFVDCTPFDHYYIVVPNPGTQNTRCSM